MEFLVSVLDVGVHALNDLAAIIPDCCCYHGHNLNAPKLEYRSECATTVYTMQMPPYQHDKPSLVQVIDPYLDHHLLPVLLGLMERIVIGERV